MPVNQAFTCEAGNRVMGFPKTVEDLSVAYTDATASFRLSMDGHHVLTLTVPRAEPLGEPERVEATSYSYLDGMPLRHRPVDGPGHRTGRPRRRATRAR